MRKLNLLCGLLIGLLILSSCSNNDDSNSNSIIGVWKPVKEVDVCSTGSEQSSDYSACHQQSRYTFNADGSLTIVDYQLENGDCIITYNENGVWQLNNDNLTLTIGGETNNPTFFELTNNTLRVGYYDSDPNDPCDGGNLPSHYYTEFNRVE